MTLRIVTLQALPLLSLSPWTCRSPSTKILQIIFRLICNIMGHNAWQKLMRLAIKSWGLLYETLHTLYRIIEDFNSTRMGCDAWLWLTLFINTRISDYTVIRPSVWRITLVNTETRGDLVWHGKVIEVPLVVGRRRLAISNTWQREVTPFTYW